MGHESLAVGLADRSVEKFYDLENAFRLFTVTGQNAYKTQYLKNLGQLKAMLDSLESISRMDDQGATLTSLLKTKTLQTNMFLKLKSINDSLILASSKLQNIQSVASPVFKPLDQNEVDEFIKTTTVVTEPRPQKKLLKRIADAISNKEAKESVQTTTITVAKEKAEQQSDITGVALNTILRNSIANLTYTYKQLNEKERRLILSNERLLLELASVIRQLKQYELDIQTLNNDELKRETSVSIAELSSMSRLILVISCALAVIILYSAWRLYKNERQLIYARNEAIRQARLRGDFLAQMSHEIRTPLNTITGFAEQLASSNLDNVQKNQVGAMVQSSNLLLSIVNDVLDYSKFETGEHNLDIVNFDPSRVIREVISSLNVLADKKEIQLVCKCNPEFPKKLAGDEYRLRQVLINLINNAIKFTDKGIITVGCTIKDFTLYVNVSDTGKGIASEDLPGIFNKFTQVASAQGSERHNGSGLGLAICKRIIEAQNGEIGVTSELGKGSVFSFKIPYQAAATLPEATVAEKPYYNLQQFEGKRILIAEDDVLNRKLLTTILSKSPVDFDIVENGKLAFELFEEKQYDLILSDINMPEVGGIALTRMIREHSDEVRSQTPVLALTANAMQTDLEEYEAIGMNDHIVKPFSEEGLLIKILKNLN